MQKKVQTVEKKHLKAFRTTRIAQSLSVKRDTADLDVELPDFSYDRASVIVKAAAPHFPSQA